MCSTDHRQRQLVRSFRRMQSADRLSLYVPIMFGPDQAEGCPSYSLVADNIVGSAVHLANRDTALVIVSRAPISQIEAFRKRMGWNCQWVSSNRNSFNWDFHVSFTKDDVEKGEARCPRFGCVVGILEAGCSPLVLFPRRRSSAGTPSITSSTFSS